MSVEQLLKPRVKMIAPVPEYGMEVGTVITPDEYGYFEVRPGYKMNLVAIKQFPHIYKPLHWWEEREESEMPEYLKSPNGTNLCKVLQHFQQANRDNAWCFFPELNGNHYVNYKYIIPATLAEYTDYLTQINKQ